MLPGIKAANSVEVIEPDDPEFEVYWTGTFCRSWGGS